MSRRLLQAWAGTLRRFGGERAIVQAADGRSLTFRELDARATAWLAACGSSPRALAGRAVVFALPNGIGWFEVFLGLVRAGAVAVPLDAAEPPAAQQRLAEALRAGFRWDGSKLVKLEGARRYRDPSISLIKLTSGTTGAPRPLVFTAAQLLADGRQVTATMGLDRRDLNYALIPLGHSYGLGNLTVPLLAQGVPLVCGSAPLPHAIAADFARWRPTVFPGVPVLWRALAEAAATSAQASAARGGGAPGIALTSLRLGITAGAPLPPEVAHQFAIRFGRRLHNFYGSSETGGIAYDATGRATLAGGAGRALRGVSLTVRRGQRLRVCSAAVATHGNRDRVGRLGCWLMPDRVVVGVHGELTLLGRRGAIVKISGRRVNLAEVVAGLRQLAGVRDAWVGVCGGIDPVLGAVIATERTVPDLRAALHAGTAAWKIPKKIVTVPMLPVTVRGKSDTRALRAIAFGPGV
jgi:acyl-CoA synthetase (AMP-forming)/AMP-acid ligase II